MRYLIFNSKKSLDQKKLIFDESFLITLFEYFHYLIIIIFPLILGIGFLLVQIKVKNLVLFPLSVTCLILSIFLSRFIFIHIKKSFKFRRTLGIDRKTNIDLITDICEENNWKILSANDHSHVILIENAKAAYHSGRELFIIYEGKSIYIRCLTYGIYDSINPFHWIGQRKIEETLVRSLKTKWFGS